MPSTLHDLTSSEALHSLTALTADGAFPWGCVLTAERGHWEAITMDGEQVELTSEMAEALGNVVLYQEGRRDQSVRVFQADAQMGVVTELAVVSLNAPVRSRVSYEAAEERITATAPRTLLLVGMKRPAGRWR